jgi:ligand-binding SRPBCC domain-containing protein
VAHFEAGQRLPVPLPKVFAFFSDPTNLPRIMPAELQVRIERSSLVLPKVGSGEIFEALELHKAAGAGLEFVFSFRPIPWFLLRMEWHARIEEWEPGSFVSGSQCEGGYFRDSQLSGLMHHWNHRHEFLAELRDGREVTLIRDVVDFEIGYGWPGRLLERFFVLPAMRKSFAHRQRQVEQALGSV